MVGIQRERLANPGKPALFKCSAMTPFPPFHMP